MSEDAGRARPVGNLGPDDPTADPPTHPGLAPAAPGPLAVPGSGPAPPSAASGAPRKHTRTGALWVGLILAAVVLLFLLVFILQNGEPVQISFFNLDGVLPVGVALLLAAIAGVLLGAIPGSLRIRQLKREIAALRRPSP